MKQLSELDAFLGDADGFTNIVQRDFNRLFQEMQIESPATPSVYLDLARQILTKLLIQPVLDKLKSAGDTFGRQR